MGRNIIKILIFFLWVLFIIGLLITFRTSLLIHTHDASRLVPVVSGAVSILSFFFLRIVKKRYPSENENAEKSLFKIKKYYSWIALGFLVLMILIIFIVSKIVLK